MSTLCRAFPVEKPSFEKPWFERPWRGMIADPARPKPQTLISVRNLVGCHGISSVKWGLGRPQTGSALHHLVTAVSVKKALMGLRQSFAGRRE
jgi:hypothetical protein